MEEKSESYTVKELLEENKLLKEDIKRLIKEMPYVYTAGFNDGEGCIGICKSTNSNYKLNSSLDNTNLEILVKMKDIFNGNIHPKKERIDHPNWKKAWNWQITNRNDLKFFLEKILPYSTVKRQQIIYALKYLELTTNTIGRTGISYEEKELRKFFYNSLQEMKDIEYSEEELKIFEEKINDLNEDKGQPKLEDFK